MTDEQKKSVVVDATEVLSYLNRIKPYLQALVDDLNNNISSLEKMLNETNPTNQGDNTNGG